MRKRTYSVLFLLLASATLCEISYETARMHEIESKSEDDLLLAENVLAITENGRYDIPWKALGEESCTIKKVNGDVAITVNGVVIKPHASYEVEGTKKDCSFWPFAVCNPDAITLCHEIK